MGYRWFGLSQYYYRTTGGAYNSTGVEWDTGYYSILGYINGTDTMSGVDDVPPTTPVEEFTH